jgi:hypothetical protein
LTTVITTTAVTTTATTSAAGAAGGPSKRGETQTKPPQWACDCSDLARFSSACACAGFQPRTVTASAPTVILTVDAVTPTSTIYAVGQTTVGATGKILSKYPLTVCTADRRTYQLHRPSTLM